MVQNATAASKRLGRRPAFDHDSVVAAAIGAFWSKGFEATTLSDLEEATGLDRSSIYNSFGGKDGLYRTAMAAYVESANAVLFDPLFNGTDGVADIVEFLQLLKANLSVETNPQGCLIVNDMAAAVDRQTTDRYLAQLEGGLLAALERASSAGEVNSGSNDQRSRVLAVAVLGINVAHRHNGSTADARTSLAALQAEAESWVGTPR